MKYVHNFIFMELYNQSMRYITSKNDEDINIQFMLEAKLHTYYNGEKIADVFTNQFDFMNPIRKSSRAMYPDSETVGASFAHKDSSGKIYSDRIEINTEDFNKIYMDLSNWFENVRIELPDKNEFIVKSIFLNSNKDTHKLTLDSAKISENSMLKMHNENNSNTGIRERLYQFQDFVNIDLIDLDMNISEAKDIVNEILKKEYVLIIEKE